MKSSIAIPLSDVVRELMIAVDITGAREFRFRLWIASRLMRLADLASGWLRSDHQRRDRLITSEFS
jgi:hypothetical protein